MSENLKTRSLSYSPSFKRLLSELQRELRECEPTDGMSPSYVERPVDDDQPSGYPRLFMGIESEEGVYEISIPGIDEPLNVIGHVNEGHMISVDGIPPVHHLLTLQGLVIRDGQHILEDPEVDSLADMLVATS